MNNQNSKLLNLYGLFVSSREAGREAEAIAAMTELLQLVPDWEHGQGWMELGLTQFDLGNFEAALECCEKARKFAALGQTNLDYILDPLTAEILAANGKLEESLTMIKESLREAVAEDCENGLPELNAPWSARTQRINDSWVKRNSSLYKRLYFEIPEGAKFWKFLESKRA